MGRFAPVVIEEKGMGSYVVAYQEFVGPYDAVDTVLDKVSEALAEDSVSSSLGMGIFYDDPSVVASDKLKSNVGYVINEEDAGDHDDYDVSVFVAGESIVTSFPYRNSFSHVLAPMKIVPLLQAYLEEHEYEGNLYEDYSVIELYDMEKGEIIFVISLGGIEVDEEKVRRIKSNSSWNRYKVKSNNGIGRGTDKTNKANKVKKSGKK